MKTQKDCSTCSHDCCRRPVVSNSGGAFYGMGLIGAAVYYFPHLGNGSEFFLTLVKIIFWPAFLVYRALTLLGM